MNELEKLVNERNALVAVLKRVNETILDKQIIKEGHMKMFGFEKVTEGLQAVIYMKVVGGAPYEVILDLTMPTEVAIHRAKLGKVHSFEIESVDDLRDILIFTRLI